jgi:hypothetical protein
MSFITACLRAVVNFFAEILFGCSHGRLTRPFTLGEETYKVCLECGKQIYYSPLEMRPLTAREIRRMKAASAGEVKVVSMPASVPHLVPGRERKPHIAA